MILFLDIETEGLTADIYQLTCAATITTPEATGLDPFKEVFFISKPSSERGILETLRDQKIKRCNKVVVWRKLDIPFLQTRALVYQMPFPVNVPVIDLNTIVVNNLTFSQTRFKDLIAFLGIKREKNENFDGAQMPGFYKEYERGNLKRKDDIILHCMNDVNNLYELWLMLKEVGLIE